MKVLITGGAGFIGYHTAKVLLARGDEVVLVDNFNDYYDVALKRKRAALAVADGAVLYECDISDYGALEQVFVQEKVDKVFNLAAQAGVRYSIENPFAYVQSNVLGFVNILEICRRQGVKDIVFASSSSVYGENEKVPFEEDDRVDHPISIYAATKKSNEEMAYTYHHLYGLNCTGLRFFTVYGPWGRPDMALFKFAQRMKAGEKIPVFNAGKMSRDFTFISDIVQGVVASLDRPFGYEVFNLGRGEVIQLTSYIEALEKHMGFAADKDLLPMQPGDVPITSADVSKAKNMLGYDPKVSVDEGVRLFVEWFNEYYGV
ncbi:SDR family NAD(P)-dependent oxidoreductase [Candidatus Woesearchaeota archaeon]|nr:SDR family NAD(P)-dependent oxidoreductase [Candidatus Woesearchaeota archaeon]